MRSDGTRIRRITRADSELTQDAGPAWSPGGGWIAFSGHRNRSDESRIYRVTPAGRGLKRLTTITRR
jgi:Tol biopolymer transport system component